MVGVDDGPGGIGAHPVAGVAGVGDGLGVAPDLTRAGRFEDGRHLLLQEVRRAEVVGVVLEGSAHRGQTPVVLNFGVEGDTVDDEVHAVRRKA